MNYTFKVWTKWVLYKKVKNKIILNNIMVSHLKDVQNLKNINTIIENPVEDEI